MIIQTTAFYASLCFFWYSFLTLHIVRIRKGKLISIGDGGDTDLFKAIRIHGNFSEYVPFSLLLLYLFEISDFPILVVHIFGICIFLSRILHFIGLKNFNGKSWQRVAGMVLILFPSAVMSLSIFLNYIINFLKN